MPNANYGGRGAAQAARGLAYATEAYVQNTDIAQFVQEFPLLVNLFKSNGPKVAAPKIISPVWGANGTSFVGKTRAEEASDTLTPAQGDGSQLELPSAAYYSSQMFTYSEVDLYMNGSTQKRIDLAKGRAYEAMDAYMTKLQTDLCSSQDAAENIVLGLPFALATANTVHNISQSSNAYWRASVTTSTGVFTATMLDDTIDSLKRTRKSNPSLLMCGTTTQNLYSKVKDILGSNLQVVQNVNTSTGTWKGGFDLFVYRGITVAGDHFMPAGEIWLLDESTLHFHGDRKPRAVDTSLLRVPKAMHYEKQYMARVAVFCNSPRKNHRWTGATA